MKKNIFSLAVTITIIAGTIFASCQSATQKQEATQEKVQEARKDLNEAKKDANEAAMVVATAEEWKTFRNESELKIRENEIRITELNAKMKKPGEIFDALYQKKIVNLEQQNRDMRARLDVYEKNQSNWESFKREFNHDMEAIGTSLKDLAVNNKN